ncbi:MAG TPA: hypothetical protein VM694_10990 [Polyangium sp.]|jgi:hypothetical protein|nr:hypothetical protein [Polyangium sp.]
MALVPLGCSAKIRYPEVPDERSRVPDATAERLRACVDESGGELPRGRFTFDVALTVDEDGQVVDVKSKGVPHEELAICMRMALRAMTVPEELVRLRELRLPEAPAAANEQAAHERGLVGHPGVLVAVAVVLAELVIEVGPTLVVLAASVELSGDIAEAIQKKPKWKDDCNKQLKDCLDSPLQSKWGATYNAKRCNWCWDKCNEKGWPKNVPVHDGQFETCVY